jgi:hypothetical protein
MNLADTVADKFRGATAYNTENSAESCCSRGTPSYPILLYLRFLIPINETSPTTLIAANNMLLFCPGLFLIEPATVA